MPKTVRNIKYNGRYEVKTTVSQNKSVNYVVLRKKGAFCCLT